MNGGDDNLMDENGSKINENRHKSNINKILKCRRKSEMNFQNSWLINQRKKQEIIDRQNYVICFIDNTAAACSSQFYFITVSYH